jgi:hypothetical protein
MADNGRERKNQQKEIKKLTSDIEEVKSKLDKMELLKERSWADFMLLMKSRLKAASRSTKILNKSKHSNEGYDCS